MLKKCINRKGLSINFKKLGKDYIITDFRAFCYFDLGVTHSPFDINFWAFKMSLYTGVLVTLSFALLLIKSF